MDVLSFDSLIRTYKYIAVFSTVFFVIKFMFFSVTGGDAEVSSDFDTISDTDSSFDFLSIQSILAFLMGFGWIGLAALTQWNFQVVYAVILSAVVGFLFMFMSAYLMLRVRALNQVVKPDYEKCLNTTGKAYTTIQPNSDGQIQIEINNKLSIINAVNTSDVKIEAFEQVKVVKVENDKLFIEKVQ